MLSEQQIELLVKLLRQVPNEDRSRLAGLVLNMNDPLYKGFIDWDTFFKELNPAHIESLDKYIKLHPINDRY